MRDYTSQVICKCGNERYLKGKAKRNGNLIKIHGRVLGCPGCREARDLTIVKVSYVK